MTDPLLRRNSRLGIFSSTTGESAFLAHPQTHVASSENACPYDGLASGRTIYAYVGGNPISFTDPMGLDPHYYSVSIPLCVGCSAADGFNAMRSFSAPRASYALNGTRDLTLAGNNPIRQTVDPCKNSITNTTLPGHIFGGQVNINVFENNEFVGAQITGSGEGPNSWLNQVAGPLIFNFLGLQASYSLMQAYGTQ